MDLTMLMGELADERPLFHSEADFQHALAWLIQRRHPDARIRLEVPVFEGSRDRLDIMVRMGGATMPVEVKYWQSRLDHTASDGERFHLVEHAAEDMNRAAFVKDVGRVERLVPGGGQGHVIALTNRSAYWREGREGTSDAAFRIHDGAVLAGSPRWRPGTAESTTKGTTDIDLRGSYVCRWRPYSIVNARLGGEFRYLIVDVTR